ncbi:MAG: helix-turn-helix domain-containing protein [Hyphomicrobium sp.]
MPRWLIVSIFSSRPELAHTIGIHVVDLIAAAVGASDDALELIANRGVKAGRIAAIRGEILAGSSDTGLTSGHGRGPHRCLGALSAPSARGERGRHSRSICSRRACSGARRALGDPRQYHKRVSDIAYEAGFGDLSYFNRCFRRRFGDTPTGVRRSHEH